MKDNFQEYEHLKDLIKGRINNNSFVPPDWIEEYNMLKYIIHGDVEVNEIYLKAIKHLIYGFYVGNSKTILQTTSKIRDVLNVIDKDAKAKE